MIKACCIAKANTRYIIRDACIERFARATSVVASALLPGLTTHCVIAGVGSIEFVLVWHDSPPPEGGTLHKVDNLDGKWVVCAVELGGELGLAATGVGLAIEIDEFTLGVGGVAIGGVLGENQDVIAREVLCPVSRDGFALDFCRQADVLLDLVKRIFHSIRERAPLIRDNNRAQQSHQGSDQYANHHHNNRNHHQHFHHREATLLVSRRIDTADELLHSLSYIIGC